MIGTSGEEELHLSREDRKHVRRRSLRLLGALARPVAWKLWVVVVLVVIANAARAAFPLLIAWSIDAGLPALQRGIEANDGSAVPTALGIGGAYALTGAVAGVGLSLYLWLTAKVSQAMLLALRVQVFKHTQVLSLEFHERYTSGKVISRQTSDLDSLRELLDQGVAALVSGLIFMSFTAASIILLDPWSGLVLAGAFIPVALLVRWYQVRSEVVYRATRVSSARAIVHFVETMTGIRAVQAYRRARANDDRYEELAEQYRDDTVESLRLFGVLQPTMVLIGNATVVALLLFGGFRVVAGDLEIGVLVALLLAGKRVFQPMEQVAMFYSSFQSASAALEKVSGVLEETPTVQYPEHPTPVEAQGHLRFTDTAFGYTDRTVLPRFDLDIPAGQTVAVVGPTGAGKSTLAKLIARFYDVSSGSLTLDGVELRDISHEQLREAVVMVTQEAFLFSGSAAENIEIGRPGASREDIEAAARAVGAHEFLSELGYDTDISARGVSAGQRQLISFARAFLADPAVLILDEATASLDLPSERAVQAGMEQLLGSRTALIIAHRLSTVLTADRVLVIDDGRIVEDGSPAQLLAEGGRFAELHRAWEQSQH